MFGKIYLRTQKQVARKNETTRKCFCEIKDTKGKIESSKAEVKLKSRGHPKRLKCERKVRRYRQCRRYDVYLIRFAQ